VPAGAARRRDRGQAAALNRVVMAATLVAALTFAVMIGCFYLASQYLQRAAGYSALGASGALVIVALLGFVLAAGGLALLAIPGMPLDNLVTILPLVPVVLGLGMLFVPTSRTALNASTVHGAMLIGCILCLVVGLPASTRLGAPGGQPGPASDARLTG
jgi:hypothetical protein